MSKLSCARTNTIFVIKLCAKVLCRIWYLHYLLALQQLIQDLTETLLSSVFSILIRAVSDLRWQFLSVANLYKFPFIEVSSPRLSNDDDRVLYLRNLWYLTVCFPMTYPGVFLTTQIQLSVTVPDYAGFSIH